MKILDAPWSDYKYERYLQAKRELEGVGEIPYFDPLTEGNTHVLHDDGRRIVNFSSYDYLGLGEHERVRSAAKAAIDRYGASCGASRLVSGELEIHRALEGALADFLRVEDAVTFVSGHATNVSTIGFLYGPGDLILCDQYCHNSILEGARLSKAKVVTFEHNSVDDLQRKLDKYAGASKRVLVCVEGLYSMDGDISPLDRIVRLKSEFSFALFVDEAHSLGTVGLSGRGAREQCDVLDGGVDIVMGSLSKSFGSCGGFIGGSSALIDYLKFQCPGFVFSTGLPAPAAAAAYESLTLLISAPQMVSELTRKADFFARSLGVDTGTLTLGTPIVPVMVDYSQVHVLCHRLRTAGIRVFPITYPAVPKEASRLRFFVSRLHDDGDLESVAATVRAAVGEKCAEPVV